MNQYLVSLKFFFSMSAANIRVGRGRRESWDVQVIRKERERIRRGNKYDGGMMGGLQMMLNLMDQEKENG